MVGEGGSEGGNRRSTDAGPMTLTRFTLHVLVISLIAAILYRPYASDFVLNVAIRPQKLLVLTAHPDDECLFFSPTILALHKLADVFSMCVSNGNSDGPGDIRKQELEKSLDVLGVEPSRRLILDHPTLQDNITVSWDVSILSDVVKPFVLDNNIDTILTFDEGGISGHPNHKSLPEAMKVMLAMFEDSQRRPKLYSLVTVPLPSKYISILAPVLAKLRLRVSDTKSITFVAGIDEYRLALRAMRQHWSQLVWFRWLNVMFSRYMWVNEWVEVVP
ncbi:N-acetylglucosaminyl-phosphatidylinositol de-N-acetylase [Marasmius tenuissimus]|nr:N-acetylglucosaminyl-phosphatidylinositol de-N-acetylase [Marasmius tenuissimus]